MTGAPRQRLDSLDVFRGVTIAAMILVSAPGTWSAVYRPLDHAAWHGWTPTDLVFPFLLFAMGAAVPFAMARRRGAPRVVRRHVLRRATLLFALGLVLNAIEAPRPLDWATFRVPGVLQRIALVYLAVTWMTERLSIRAQVAIVIAALAGYWAAMTLIPVPGAGAGVLTHEGNLASFVDRALLGRHLLTALYDPEGLLSTVPAIATAMAGVFAGRWLNVPPERAPDTHRRTASMFAAGFVAATIGLAWGEVFPINKNLWTSSFAVLAAGMAAAVMAACHFSVDIRGWRGWSRPFIAFGRNPLAAYFLSVGLDSVLTRWVVGNGTPMKAVLYSRLFAATIQPCCGAEAASLAYAVAYVMLWGVVMLEMQRRGIFVGI
jgi:predicted acyltransferase